MPGRDYAQLLEAMNELLAVLSTDGGQETALKTSFLRLRSIREGGRAGLTVVLAPV